MNSRTEHDTLGQKEIPAEVYWGIHTQRAVENFQLSAAHVEPMLIKAYAYVKKAAAHTNRTLGFLYDGISDAILSACDEIIDGRLSDQFPLDAFQGGAGTSLNMNLNEVIANRALEIMGHPKGEYEVISPLDHVNMHQSTNDTFPTALKTAAIFYTKDLEEALTKLLQVLQFKEREFGDIVKIGRTQMQDAVPMIMGAEFGGYAQAITEDRWRVSKTRERLRVVNLGGTAIGTGLGAPRDYIFSVVQQLNSLTGLNLTRAENIVYATQNIDGIVESSGILKTCAVNISKICSDLRLMNLLGEIKLPAVQAGSSIMPGKVNPVITEAVTQGCFKVFANDSVINQAAAAGTLEICEFLPLIAHSFLETLRILINSALMLAGHIEAATADKEKCLQYLDTNPVTMTALVPELGYEKVADLVKEYNQNNCKNVRQFLIEKLGLEKVEQILSPQNLLKIGF